MKGLSKSEIAEKASHVAAISDAADELRNAIDQYNNQMREAWEAVNLRVIAYNQKIEAANEWQTGVVDNARALYDEKSEKWQEGERGQAMSEFIETYDDALEEIDLPEPDEIDAPDLDDATTLKDRPDEVST